MKKILFILLCLPAILASAANENPKYLRGAVPERDGIVTFTIYPVVKTYIQQLVTNARQDLRTRIVSDQDNTIVANVEEIMTFRKKFLNWDHCFFRYLISAQCTPDSKVTLTITKISYQYQFDNEGNGGENFKAEEWISDAAAVNKAGTKLYPRCGKFRRKTIDRVEEIFTGARDAFETPAAPVAPQPKATVVE